jgi:hypothetical protein
MAYPKAAIKEKKAAVAFLRFAARSALRTGSKTHEPESKPTSGKGGTFVIEAHNQKNAATKDAPQLTNVAHCSTSFATRRSPMPCADHIR